MLPKELQDIAFQLSKDGEELDYKEVVGRVLGVAMNRVQERIPQMGKSVYGIGEGWDWGGADVGGDDGGWGCEAEIDALGKGNAGVACYRCGGKGHMAKECSTPAGMVEGGKGKGKGSGGKGKGTTGTWYSKGAEWKGETGNWKGGVGCVGKNGGGGKGYQGTCWTCGRIGHKANEGKCGGGKGLVAEVGEEPGSFTGAVSTGGVWTISSVEAESRTGVG